MKQFTSVQDVANLQELVNEALQLKQNPYKHKQLGENKTLGLIFLNPSLRTRLSTQKAAINLGMNVMVMNLDKEGWALETQEGAIMNGTTVEHIKEAAAVMGQYCDILGIRSFPKLQNREEDYSEELLQQFIKYSKIPVVSLESATRHPLQSLADLITITENKTAGKKPKVVLTWAPHIKPIPQCVANSFAEWMRKADVELVITHPEGYELSDEFTAGATVTTNQQEALEDADFVYVKNWSSYNDYGQVLTEGEGWMLTEEKLQRSNNAKVMHCLPVRRNVELSDEILDGSNSLVLEQANNRTFAAQAVLKRMLESLDQA
ncbi:N-acetylornithine carbamoyltransferase [Pontibacter sp. MBLB2868]|uniref:N-acetylornithine carbamoyltransferase n=1 Tax=Pontibacter sp. MBLB2868 TaxID=3451555 RepID=UPI003F753D13